LVVTTVGRVTMLDCTPLKHPKYGWDTRGKTRIFGRVVELKKFKNNVTVTVIVA
jgi:hypothetical protein